MISAYQQQSCGGGGGGDGDGPAERERESFNQHTKFNALFVCINCTGANQTGDSSDFIFPSHALVQLFRLIAFFSVF